VNLQTDLGYRDVLTLKVKWNSRDGNEHETVLEIYPYPETGATELRVDVNNVLCAMHDRQGGTLVVREK
jgi:hypothetical protein